jgi:hypothetical protein
MARRAAEALEEARDRVWSLGPDCEDIKPELRQAFRAGFSQARLAAALALTHIINKEGVT